MTGARDAILAAVRAARPPAVALPEPRARADRADAPLASDVARFAEAARAAGSEVIEASRTELAALLGREDGSAARVLSAVPDVASSAERPADLRELRDLDLYVCEARLGVAENGAMWLDATRAPDRAALFLAQRVAIVLPRTAIVSDLHAAYARLDVGAVPFGLFVAGPSKTADIEQSLVIGAHGPRGLLVLLV